jgi:hypothetical protein
MNIKRSLISDNQFFAGVTLFSLVLSIFMNNARAANYYVSAKGNDAANGLTPKASWLTIEKINKTKFSPGDSILFKRGDAWREGQALYGYSNGTPGHPIVFGAYGKGAKPLILASKDISSSAFWTMSAENIWKTTSKVNITKLDFNQRRQVTPDVANLIFNNEESIGVKKRFLTDLKAQGDFSLNLEDTILYMYSATNPSKYYKKIEATGIRNCENNINISNGHYLTFINLDIRYSKNNGLFLQNCSKVEILSCDFSYIGGCYYPLESFFRSTRPNTVRMGNGVQMWMGNSDVTVRNCYFNQVYDAGISPQGVGSVYTIHNLNMHHNLINNCFYSFEFWGHESGSTGDSIYFENNTCLNAGSGWSTAQRPGGKNGCSHLKFSTSKMAFKDVFIRNNIFYESAFNCSDGYAENDGAGTEAIYAPITIDYNCYYQSGEKQVIRWRGGASKGGGDYLMSDLKAYREKTGKDFHSIFADPKVNSNNTLQSGSPAIDAGLDVGYPYCGKAPDMGAFEFVNDGKNHTVNKK